MSDCVSSSPLSISITRQLGINSASSRILTASPRGHSQNGISYPKLSSYRRWSIIPSAGGAAKRSSADGSYSELGFKTDDPGGGSFRSGTKPNLGSEERGRAAADGEEKASGTLPLRNAEDGDLVQVEGKGNGEAKMGKGRQVMRRSSLMAKQVISMSSALSLGFVSQLWVDTATWMVVIVEVRSNLLSGESERFLLEEICQVGDVVLVENENVLENELKMLGLETLVGYEVVTPGRRTIGKVRGYTFNINSGAVESLELDSFGISIIPSSLDVLEVASDRVVVHEAAASRIQRLTKGLWDNQKKVRTMDEFDEYSDFEKPERSSKGRSTRRGFSSRKFHPTVGETEDDWDLPMDFL
ncbi:uncharacterized protein LOC116207983 isoform X2 [Punica granatum]|uniref:Uncharacterized protein LOC116207983 isoform X2 n=1 Tax=Punica granatum TaxID=22663 RepID=A0A6P8DUV4_PUNGR|nr:uncharacterized protein LOC116207983 isoform X2 [Punica granatum]